MSISPTWFLLQQEGFLAQACLCNGLTALAHANIGDKKGLYYSAFFELSIGLERMMKLLIILDHMANNNLAPPSSEAIERYQHRLERLFDKTSEICTARRLNPSKSFDSNSLPRRLLSFLDSFAHPGGRYANLNKLTGHQHASFADPLVAWGKIATQIFTEEATPAQRKAVKRRRDIARSLENVAMNLIEDLGQQHSDVEGLFARSSELETAGKHAVFALVSLVEWLRDVLEEVTDDAMRVNKSLFPDIASIPHMKEFFNFAWANKTVVMRKKCWP